ncbi:MAG: Pnap_2097 family protein [Pseudomonadota bacterium]|nr:Pnap_2097 family protein [Pseudomonadota bacterium]
MQILRHHPPHPMPTRQDRLRLGMMHLSPNGLSEQWLLRHLGDRHWDLIAAAVGQEGIAFRDADGAQVYAAFCATSLDLPGQARAQLGTCVDIHSTLFQVTPRRLGSLHTLTGAGGDIGTVMMISSFLSHDETGSNRRLLRNDLPGLGVLASAPDRVMGFHDYARGHSRALRQSAEFGPRIMSYTPIPALDFNAVGLLYFPTFSRIAEMARPTLGPLCHRDVVYVSNLNPGETIHVHGTGNGPLTLATDDRPLAIVTTGG